MREEQVVLEHDADRAPLGRHEHALAVVEHHTVELDAAAVDGDETGERAQERRLARAVRAEDRDRLALGRLQLGVEIERSERERDVRARGSSDTEPAVAEEREHRDAHREQHDAQADRDVAGSDSSSR